MQLYVNSVHAEWCILDVFYADIFLRYHKSKSPQLKIVLFCQNVAVSVKKPQVTAVKAIAMTKRNVLTLLGRRVRFILLY